MANINDFQVFAGAGGANVLSQANYLALSAKATGFQSGIATSAQLNKVWRQSSITSAMIGQFIADHALQDAIDDGTVPTLEARFIAAIQGVTLITLTADLSLYVNPSSGNDANSGLTLTTAFRTIQAAFNAGYANYNYNQHALYVRLAPGTYTSGIGLSAMPVGCTFLNLIGDVNAPASYQINGVNTNTINVNVGVRINILGISVTATGTSTSQVGLGYSIVIGMSYATIASCIIGSSGTCQLLSSYGSICSVQSVTLQGSSQYGLLSQQAALLWLIGATITYNSPVYGIANIYAATAGNISASGAIITGSASGPRYLVNNNGILNTNGGGPNFFPGTVAGSVLGAGAIYA